MLLGLKGVKGKEVRKG